MTEQQPYKVVREHPGFELRRATPTTWSRRPG